MAIQGQKPGIFGDGNPWDTPFDPTQQGQQAVQPGQQTAQTTASPVAVPGQQANNVGDGGKLPRDPDPTIPVGSPPPPPITTQPVGPKAPDPAPTAGVGPIPTNPDGTQIGAGIPWDPKTGAPSYAPPGYHWDAKLAMFQPGAATGPGGMSVQDFIKQWQQGHSASEGMGPLTAALAAAGYTNATRFMYGQTPSNNELNIDGQKYKVISGEDGTNPGWYTAGTNDGGGGQPPPNPYSGPTTTIGTDPLSLQIDASLKKLLEDGGSVHSAAGDAGQKALLDYFARGGNSNARLESIREKMGMLSRAQMSDARSDLASRGLLSEGSNSQGAELSTLGRVNANIAQQGSTAARDALIADDTTMQTAIQTATGLDQNATRNLLDTAKTATDRQNMLSQIALQSLSQNIQWNEFLANYGLDRDKLMADIQNGQVGNVTQLLNAFAQWMAQSSKGYV